MVCLKAVLEQHYYFCGGHFNIRDAECLIVALYNEVNSSHKMPFKMVGGESDPRNKALMKMFNLINIGEHAGSGIANNFNVWADEG